FKILDWIWDGLWINMWIDVQLFWLSLLAVYGVLLFLSIKTETSNGTIMLVNLAFSSIIFIAFFSPDSYWTKFMNSLTLAMTFRCVFFFKSPFFAINSANDFELLVNAPQIHPFL